MRPPTDRVKTGHRSALHRSLPGGRCPVLSLKLSGQLDPVFLTFLRNRRSWDAGINRTGRLPASGECLIFLQGKWEKDVTAVNLWKKPVWAEMLLAGFGAGELAIAQLPPAIMADHFYPFCAIGLCMNGAWGKRADCNPSQPSSGNFHGTLHHKVADMDLMILNAPCASRCSNADVCTTATPNE